MQKFFSFTSFFVFFIFLIYLFICFLHLFASQFNNDTRLKPLYLEEDWCIRRSERIFLNDSSPQPSPNSIRGPAQNTSQQGSLATSGTNMNNTLTKTSTRISRSNSGANPSNITSSGSVTPTALGSSITASTTGTLSAPDSQKPSRTRKVVQKSKEKETKASRKTVSPQRAHMVVTTPTNTTTNSMSSTASTSNVTETSSLAYHSCHTNSTVSSLVLQKTAIFFILIHLLRKKNQK